MENTPIRHVSDTAFWVATFRARETERPDAVFRDPLARRLVGEEGERIVEQMERPAAVGWSVVVRTCLIDDYIRHALPQGVDVILNLGAGLDTRPYRMELPNDLLWIEVDYPGIIQFKEERLQNERPRCRLERVSVDLAVREERIRLFSEVQSRSRKVLILTEGVLPYLTNENVSELAEDLHAQSHFEFWVVDFWSRLFAARMRKSKTFKKLRNAPFRFDPPEWTEFFKKEGWEVDQVRYLAMEGKKIGRRPPIPMWLKIVGTFLPAEKKKQYAQMSGYALLRAHR
ncbi:class I SAM-dependent methyltransferase [Verrucomicrobiota bacterium sgz303538]